MTAGRRRSTISIYASSGKRRRPRPRTTRFCTCGRRRCRTPPGTRSAIRTWSKLTRCSTSCAIACCPISLAQHRAFSASFSSSACLIRYADQTQWTQRTQRKTSWSCLGVLRVLCVDSAPLHRIENRSSDESRSDLNGSRRSSQDEDVYSAKDRLVDDCGSAVCHMRDVLLQFRRRPDLSGRRRGADRDARVLDRHDRDGSQRAAHAAVRQHDEL